MKGTRDVPNFRSPMQRIEVILFKQVSRDFKKFSVFVFVKVLIKSPVLDISASNTNLLMSALGYFLLNSGFSRLVASSKFFFAFS